MTTAEAAVLPETGIFLRWLPLLDSHHRDGGGDGVVVKGGFGGFVEGEKGIPIFFGWAPSAQLHGVFVLAERGDNSNRRGIGQKVRITGRRSQQAGADSFWGIRSCHDTRDADKAFRAGGEVGDIAAGHGRVGNDDFFVVQALQRGGEDADFLDRAFGSAGHDVIPAFEGTEKDEQKSGGEVREIPLQSQPDGQTGGGDQRGELRGGHAELTERSDDHQHKHRRLRDVGQIDREGRVHALPVERLQEKPMGKRGHPAADQINRNGRQD